MLTLLTTQEVARLLKINEKMVYSLIAEKGLPATKVTGKWLFPQALVERWLEQQTVNNPLSYQGAPSDTGLLVVAGSNDVLLERAFSFYHRLNPENLAVFGNLGSMGGLAALRRGQCHMATSHLLQDDGGEFNFEFAAREVEEMPAVVNFCRRAQGLLVAKGNPGGIESVADLAKAGTRIVNRAPGTGTRLLLDRELAKAGVDGAAIEGYGTEVARHLDAGIEVLAGRADAAPGIEAVAGLLGLDFVPIHWERYDLLIAKNRFFDRPVQLFLGMLHEPGFRDLTAQLRGYDLSLTGRMVYPSEGEDGAD